jgi:hypothetical protein
VEVRTAVVGVGGFRVERFVGRVERQLAADGEADALLRRACEHVVLAVAADTARLVRYLASDAASGVTGRVIRVVPGWLD